MPVLFDTLAYSNKLRAAGFTAEQAGVQAETMVEIIEDKLATKKELLDVEANLRRDMKEIEANLRRDMKELETNLKRDIIEMELRLKHDLTIRLGGMMVACVTIVAAIVTIF